MSRHDFRRQYNNNIICIDDNNVKFKKLNKNKSKFM